MKKIVPFIKTINFDQNVDEVTSISLDRKVNDINNKEITGEFDLYLEYKESDISVTPLKYNDTIPFSIDIDDRYLVDNVKVDIDDFYYELDNNSIILHIDLEVDGLEYDNRDIEELIDKVETNEDVDDSESDNTDVVQNDSIDRNNLENDDLFLEKEEKVEVKTPIYQSFDPEKEDYVTYNVHIVREDDNIDSICLKYGVTKEDLSYYNDINTIKLGDKLIVPNKK